MNTAKYTSIGDLIHCICETRKCPRAWLHIRGDAERRILSKLSGKHERRSPTHAGMSGRILGMGRGAGREKVQPGYPIRIGIGRSHSLSEGGDRPPENVAI